MKISKRKKMSAKKLTCIIAPLLALLIALAILLPVITVTYFDPVMRDFFGEAGVRATATGGSDITDKLDKQYNKSKFSTTDQLDAYERQLVRESGAEGYVLLKNENNTLPLSKNKTISLFSHSSVDIIAGGTGSGTGSSDVTLKDAFEAQGYTVNGTLWDFYSTGAGSGYTRGAGSLNYGGGEDWTINECPINVLRDGGVLSSATGTTAIFVISRTGGEGRDLARYMGNFTSIEEDKSKHYLEPDSVELGVIAYLNENFKNVIIIANTNNAIELGWTENYQNISAILWAPGGGGETANSIVDVLSGAVSPSGRLVDTFAYDAFSSPAMQNMGDIALTVNGSTTGYYGVSYDEGIYVGYKYYETRYYDKVMSQGNAGNYDYSSTVQYPFGYGLTYSELMMSDFTLMSPDSDGNMTVSVKVSNVSDGVPAKEVVQVYANFPYTQFDATNYIEKSAVNLVGFAKTEEIQPGESATVEIKVNLSDLVSYDDVVNKTYILEEGAYLLTVASDAHEAANNFLAYEGKNISHGMTADGDASFVGVYNQVTTDVSTYSKSSSGTGISNVFGDDGLGDSTSYIDRNRYLSRQDWAGTFPKCKGTESNAASSFSEKNGHTYYWDVSQTVIDKLAKKGTAEAANSLLTDTQAAEKALPVGQEGSIELIDYRGVDFDASSWDNLISQITVKEMQKIVNQSGYMTDRIDSINKPKATDLDGPAGLNNMVNHAAYSITYPAEVNMAASWNTKISYDWGEAVGMDGLRASVMASGWYAPAMNIHRTPFAGRNFEYFSEDAYLSGALATETVKGAASMGMYSFIKHFALNDQEDHRCDNGIATFANEQTIREIYLEPFRMVVENSGTVKTMRWVYDEESGEFTQSYSETPACTAVMSSFNRVGYTWAGGDYRLITQVLREEWGFRGIVLTDYSQGATSYMHNAQMLRAGGDAALTQYTWGGTLNIDSDALRYYAQQAVKNVCYTVVNSNAMNGYVHGLKLGAEPFPYYYLILIAVGVVAVGLTAWGVTAIILRIRNEKKSLHQ